MRSYDLMFSRSVPGISDGSSHNYSTHRPVSYGPTVFTKNSTYTNVLRKNWAKT